MSTTAKILGVLLVNIFGVLVYPGRCTASEASTETGRATRAERYRKALRKARRTHRFDYADAQKIRMNAPGVLRIIRRELLKSGHATLNNSLATEWSKLLTLAMATRYNLQELRAEVESTSKNDPSESVRREAAKVLAHWTSQDPQAVRARAEMPFLSEEVRLARAKRKQALKNRLVSMFQAERDTVIARVRAELKDLSVPPEPKAEREKRLNEKLNRLYLAVRYDLRELRPEFDRIVKQGASPELHQLLWIILNRWDRAGADTERAKPKSFRQAGPLPGELELGKAMALVASLRSDLWESRSNVSRLANDDASPKVREAAALVLGEWSRQTAEQAQALAGAQARLGPTTARSPGDAEKGERELAKEEFLKRLNDFTLELRERLTGFSTLTHYEFRELTPELERVEIKDPEPKVRLAARRILDYWATRDAETARSRIGHEQAKWRLAHMTPQQMYDDKRRQERASYLARRGQLLNQMRYGTTESRRAYIMEARDWAKGVPEVVPILRKIAEADENPILRNEALTTLVRLDPTSKETVSYLKSSLEPGNACRLAAAKWLGRYGHKEGLPVLIEALGKAKDPRAQIHLMHDLRGITRMNFVDLKLGLMRRHKSISDEDKSKLQKGVKAWQKWWKEEGDTFVLPYSRARQARTHPATTKTEAHR